MLTKCIAAEPHHGPAWQEVAKDPPNVERDLRQLLVLVSDKVEELK